MSAWKNIECPNCMEVFSAGDLYEIKGQVFCPYCNLSFPLSSFKVIE